MSDKKRKTLHLPAGVSPELDQGTVAELHLSPLMERAVRAGETHHNSDDSLAFGTYRPSGDEPYMCDRQVAYYRERLEAWCAMAVHVRDYMNSNVETVRDARIRQKKDLRDIERALKRFDLGTYGYCEETGEPIGIARLNARPTASCCLEVAERKMR